MPKLQRHLPLDYSLTGDGIWGRMFPGVMPSEDSCGWITLSVFPCTGTGGGWASHAPQ